MKVTNKRPLTVSSQFLCVLTKILNERMTVVSERENLYGSTQYGFRAGRSTSDCIFLLLAAVRKLRRKKYKISVAFCDLKKAYDSVDREILYDVLTDSGFGGKVLDIVQSMYYNDRIQIYIGNALSSPLWFTRGVKQGCCLSPLLFALYMSGLGVRLQQAKLGIKVGRTIVSGLFFADDLVLISKTCNRGMNKLLGIVNKFCQDMRMQLSVEKTHILTTGPKDKWWRVDRSSEGIKETLAAKYLGVVVQLRGRNTMRREKDLLNTARRTAHAILSLTRAGLDRARVARILWESCALPTCLYGVEAMSLKKETVAELEKIQTLIGNFILQVPVSTSKVASWLDAGLVPIKFRVWLNKARYFWKIMNKKKDEIIKECVQEMLDVTDEDPWIKDIREIEVAIGEPIQGMTIRGLKKAILEVAASDVLEAKQAHPSMSSMPQPVSWFRLQSHVNDSMESKTLNQIRAGNAQLGNRMKNRLGKQWKLCPWCGVCGRNYSLRESHVILLCGANRVERQVEGVAKYLEDKMRSGVSEPYLILREYLGGTR